MRRVKTFAALFSLIAMLAFAPPVFADGSWLDAPLTDWNVARTIPAPPPVTDSVALSPDDPLCSDIFRAATSPEDQQLADAGWHLYHQPEGFRDGAWSNGTVTVVLATSAYDGMCRPWHYQAFAFVDGQYAGTLSPEPMDSRFDGDLSSVRLGGKTIIAGFEHCQVNDQILCRPMYPTFVQYQVFDDGSGEHLVPSFVLHLVAPDAEGI